MIVLHGVKSGERRPNSRDCVTHLSTCVPVLGKNRPPHLNSSRWHPETRWKIAVTMSSLTAAMVDPHLI